MTNATTDEVSYDIFISYRHGGEDQAIAELLHRQLEGFRTPASLVRRGFPARLTRVFRDRDELPTSSDLSDSILAAIKASRFLVIVCSPRARQSKWIAKEIEVFRAMGKGAQILTLLIDGEPADAFPDVLIDRRRVKVVDADGHEQEIEQLTEPLAADIRAPTSKQRRRHLKVEMMRLLAPVLGCTFDDLRQRQQARARRQLMAASAVLLALAAGFASLAGYAFVKRSDAIARADAAFTYQSRVLALLSKKEMERAQYGFAQSLALEGLPISMAAPDRPLVEEPVTVLRNSARDDRLLATLSTRPGSAHVIAFSPDGKYLVAGTSKEAKVWDVATREPVWQLPTYNDIVSSLDFSPDAKKLLIAGDHRPRVYDLATGKLTLELPFSEKSWVRSARFSPDGRLIATAGNDNTVKLWSEQTGSLSLTLPGPDFDAVVAQIGIGYDPIILSVYKATWQMFGATAQIIISPDGQLVAAYSMISGSDPETAVRVFNIATGKPVSVLLGHGSKHGWSGFEVSHQINEAVFSPDGSIIASAGTDKTIRLWDPNSGQQLQLMALDTEVMKLAFDPSGRRLVTASKDGKIRIWDVDAQKILGVFDSQGSEPTALAVSADGRVVASAFSDGSARINLLHNAASIAVLRGHRDRIHQLAFSPDSQLLATASGDGDVRVWRVAARGQYTLATPRHDRRRPSRPAGLQNFIRAIGDLTGDTDDEDEEKTLISADRRLLLQKVSSRRLLLFAIDTAAPVGGLKFFDGDIKGIVFTANDQYAVVQLDGDQLVVLDRSGQKMMSAHVPKDYWTISSADYDPKEGRLVVSDDEDTWVISAAPGHADQKLGGGKPRFLADGHTLLTETLFTDHFTLWNAATGERLLEQSASLVPAGLTGRTILGLSDKSIMLFDPNNGHLLATFEGRSPTVARNAPLAATIVDDDIVLWSLDTRREVSRINASAQLQAVCNGSGDCTARKIEISADGTRLVVTGLEQNTLLYAGSGKVIATWASFRDRSGRDGREAGRDFSGDGRFVLGFEEVSSPAGPAKDDKQFRWAVFNADTGKVVGRGTQPFSHQAFSQNHDVIVLSQDGSRILFKDAGSTSVLAVSDGAETVLPQTTAAASGSNHRWGDARLEFTRDGSRVVGVESSSVLVWDAANGALVSRNSGSAVAMRQPGGMLGVYEANSLGRETFKNQLVSPLDGRTQANGEGKKSDMADPAAIDKADIADLSPDHGDFAVGPDGTRAIGTRDCDDRHHPWRSDGASAPAPKCAPWLVDVTGKKAIAELAVDGFRAATGKFSADGSIFVAPLESLDPNPPETSSLRMAVWDARTGKLLTSLEMSGEQFETRTSGSLISDDGGTIVATLGTPRVLMRNNSWSEVALQRISNENSSSPRAIEAVALSPDGLVIAGGCEVDTVCLWRATDGKITSKFKDSGEEVSKLALDGKILIVVTKDGTLRVRDLKTDRIVLTQLLAAPASSLIISLDGNRVAVLADNGDRFILDIAAALGAAALPTADLIDWARALEFSPMTAEERQGFLLGPKANERAQAPRLTPVAAAAGSADLDAAVRLALGEGEPRDLKAALRLSLGAAAGKPDIAAFSLAQRIEKTHWTPEAHETAFLFYRAALLWMAAGSDASAERLHGAERAQALGHLLPPAAVLRAYRQALTLGQD